SRPTGFAAGVAISEVSGNLQLYVAPRPKRKADTGRAGRRTGVASRPASSRLVAPEHGFRGDSAHGRAPPESCPGPRLADRHARRRKVPGTTVPPLAERPAADTPARRRQRDARH